MMYCLCDCNNFFVSCERVFNPSLNNRAVVVLSNNDGCVISRSNEAKHIGVKMGQPYFQLRHFEQEYDLVTLSSNYVLYGDMSSRVMGTLSSFVPSVEVYSIDEAFMDLSSLSSDQLSDFGRHVSSIVRRNTGIPVSIGIAPTKTLAKIATELCKKYPKLNGSCYMYRQEDISKVLLTYSIGDVWGIGRKYGLMLRDCGIETAGQFTQMSSTWVRAKMGIVGLRTWNELRGVACLDFEHNVSAKQQICTSRSFASELMEFSQLRSAVSMFANMCAEKLRKQNSLCSEITVFVGTNRHKPQLPQYFKSQLIVLPTSSDSSLELVKVAVEALRSLFISGYGYKKAGVVLSRIEPNSSQQLNLFDPIDRNKHHRLMSAVDAINSIQGRGSVSLASIDSSTVKMNRNHLSKSFTTDWNDIITVKV